MSNVVEYAQSLQTPTERRELIVDLEEAIKGMITDGAEEGEDNLNEVFCNGMYSREISLVAGTVAIGEIHKQDHINILSKGRVMVVAEEGTKELVAPYRWVGKAGIKRATFVIEDAVWTTFHATTHTTTEDVRKEFVAKTFEDVLLEV